MLATYARDYPNASGVTPLDLRILVKPDPVQDKIGNVYLSDSTKEREKYAGTKATLIAVGANAFREWGAALRPKPGDRVHFAQYSGSRITGEDGEEYVIMNDADLTSIVEAAR